MTAEQEILLNKVRANIKECRNILDHIRFRMPDAEITERERAILCRCYSCLCDANDEI